MGLLLSLITFTSCKDDDKDFQGSFTNLSADGSSAVISTKFILKFSEDIADLSVDDIMLTANSTGATNNTYTLVNRNKIALLDVVR